MKNYEKERVKRRELHAANLLLLPPECYRITGWRELVEYTDTCIEMVRRLIKMEGFPGPVFIYRQKTDETKRRENVWRRVAMWDKREVSDWLKQKALK